MKFREFLRDPLHLFPQAAFLFHFFFFMELRRQLLIVLLHSGKSESDSLFLQNDFRCRINDKRIYFFNGPLTFCIKTPDGINFIAPQFYPVRTVLGIRIYINNTAADGKLSGRFHKPCFFISQCCQFP